MNDVDRNAMNQMLSTLGQINQHLANINGSMSRHFLEDSKAFEEQRLWREAHDRRVEIREIRDAEGRGFRKGQLWILGILVTAAPFASTFLAKLLFT